MKIFTAIILFIALTGQLFQGDFIILDYYSHQQSFAAHCINKDKPAMHCNGRCQMYKMMHSAKQHEHHNPEMTVSVKVVLYCIIENLHFNWFVHNQEHIKPFGNSDMLIKNLLVSVFHPPRRLV